jgi:hypothetical protein
VFKSNNHLRNATFLHSNNKIFLATEYMDCLSQLSQGRTKDMQEALGKECLKE